ncbi:unnamed protein product, partial [Laminaria digitata]
MTATLSSLSGAQLEQAARLTLKGLHDAVKSARLNWRDVAHLRVYYLSPLKMSPQEPCPALGAGLYLASAAAAAKAA